MHIAYITAPNNDVAKTLAATLVKEKLIACANIYPSIISIYEWEGALKEEQEVVIFAKTAESNTEALVKRIKELHPYDCPCIVTFPTSSGNQDFIDWVENITKKH